MRLNAKWVERPVNFLLAELFCNFVMVYFVDSFTRSRFAPVKLVPLSHRISLTGPRRAMKRRSTLRKQSVSREVATSMWTALLTRHVKSAPYLLCSFLLSFVINGPK